jgi:anaerobic selenocysteine-containing dehydrogenase
VTSDTVCSSGSSGEQSARILSGCIGSPGAIPGSCRGSRNLSGISAVWGGGVSYPTGASKWNPIEHRLFSEISKNWVAEPLDSYETMLNFIRNTRTQTGLAVTAHLDRKEYPTGLKPDPRLISSLRLKHSNTLPKWNYTIAPNL